MSRRTIQRGTRGLTMPPRTRGLTMPPRTRGLTMPPRTRGLTMIELVLALGLFSLLMLAVFHLIDRSLSTFRAGETRRSLLETAVAVEELLATDLAGLEPGARGDLVAEWISFDTDGNGTQDAKWPRLRFVRQASAADVARVRAQTPKPVVENEDGTIAVEPAAPGLLEVVWMVVPLSLKDPQARAEGMVWRGERVVGDRTTKSFFAPDFFGASNRPPAGATEPVTGGVLWLAPLLATQTSIIHDGWNLTSNPDSVATAWDAWSRGRPDTDIHAWNAPAPGLPQAREHPILPRRVRIEVEVERPVDRLRRTVLVEPMETNDAALVVDDPRHLPYAEQGNQAFVLVEAEWMRVTSITGRTASVQRGQRGTTPVTHAPGVMVHWGERLVREVPIATYREDWDLR